MANTPVLEKSQAFQNDWLAGLIEDQRQAILAEWAEFLKREGGRSYARWDENTLRTELVATVDRAAETLRSGDLSGLGEYIRDLISRRLDDGFQLHEIGKSVFGLQSIVMQTVLQTTADLEKRFSALQSVTYLHDLVALQIAEVYQQLQAEQQQKLLEEAKGKHQLHVMLEAGKLLTSTLNLNEVLRKVARLTMQSMGADYTIVFLPDPERKRLHVFARYTRRGRPSNGVRQVVAMFEPEGLTIPRGAAGKAFDQGKPVLVKDYSKFPGDLHEVSELAGSLIAVPMVFRGEVVGVIDIVSIHEQAFTEEHLSLARGVADQAAIAVANARSYERQKNIAETLQRSFLPSQPPKPKGVELAVRYRSALTEAEVGGDFYDFFEVDPGKVAMLVADVSGKGLRAAVYTAMGKYMTRAYAVQDSSPSWVLEQFNKAFVKFSPSGIFLTAFYAVLDPEAHTLRYGNAGHNQPLFHSADREHITLLDVTGPGLGGIPDAIYSEREMSLQPNEMLLIYTDGATDVRKDGKFLGVEGLERLFRENWDRSAEEAVDAIFQGVLEYGDGNLTDDVALLVLKRESNE